MRRSRPRVVGSVMPSRARSWPTASRVSSTSALPGSTAAAKRRFDSGCEPEVRECVFVRAKDACGVGQDSEAVKRVEHLGVRAFKQATTTGAEQCVAAEQRAVARIGDVAERVSRNG